MAFSLPPSSPSSSTPTADPARLTSLSNRISSLWLPLSPSSSRIPLASLFVLHQVCRHCLVFATPLLTRLLDQSFPPCHLSVSGSALQSTGRCYPTLAPLWCYHMRRCGKHSALGECSLVNISAVEKSLTSASMVEQARSAK